MTPDTPTTPELAKPNQCLNCGNEDRAVNPLAGTFGARVNLGPVCQAKLAATWGSRPDGQNHKGARDRRIARIQAEGYEVRFGRRGGVTYGRKKQPEPDQVPAPATGA